MAKKKKRRPPQKRPVASAASTSGATKSGASDAPASKRAERKEEARLERERRIKAARRRERNRKLVRWGVVALVVAAIAGIVVYQQSAADREEGELQAAMRRLGCEPPDEDQTIGQVQQNELDAFAALGDQNHSEPYAQGQNGVPATAGAHTGALPGDPQVFNEPIPEANVVHNLEHGYVVVYYAADGDNALPEPVVTALADRVEEESEVLLAPYPDLASSMALVSWGTLQTCTPEGEASPDDAVAVTDVFIDEWKNSGQAPESAA